jgi:TatD DNase family protein
VSDRERRDEATKMKERPPAPEPLRQTTVDSHCHMDLHTSGGPQSEEVRAVLDEASSVGVDRVVQVGIDVSSSQWAADCADSWPGRVLAAVALHPNESPLIADLDDALRAIEELAARSRVRVIGETGLDHFRTEPDLRQKQEYSFRAHIEIAKRTGRALMIHDRDAHDDVLRVLREEGAPDRVIFHCYSGDEEMARECVREGYFLSFAGTVTFKNARNLHAALQVTPVENMLIETDAPFLTPTPHRGAPNASYLIPHTLRFIAHAREIEADDLAGAISTTAEGIFGPF